ncbi:hydroxymethylglutaryl-CoA lyase [Dactylosporangium siamense]|uniref:Hydroxymethylglutaryl-CoA lyase n=1 Tax=Dactylosporangium siamense TaxID=685454 RepID=A0A919PWZ5_9ACTN|nr:hydroxymethylglutaryl-CoA lyase [Dactylosporangium siamense]GIG50781.1 hydroxymethylglutaryl-CoA lyase [Dactylosporangium siamense]
MTGVEIVEVGPRDGLQNEKVLLPTEVKVDYITRALDAGIRRMEATAFVHPGRVPQMADAEAVMAAVPRRDGVTYIGLVLNRRGLERALNAGVDEVNVVVVASDEFSRRNQGTSTEEALDVWHDIAETAAAHRKQASLTIAAAFGCPFTGEVPVSRVQAIAASALRSRPREIAIADTIGVGVPTQVRALVAALRELDADVPLRAHFHNTRNTGYANAVAALEAGVRTLDASIGGIGGCPFAPAATGNIATEDLTYLLQGMGVHTGLDLPALAGTGTWIGERLGIATPALLGRTATFPPATR